MKLKRQVLFLLMLLPFIMQAQQITKGEYFLDTDPGAGNGTALPAFTAGDSITQTVNLNTTGLSVGFHRVYYRYKYNTGTWGIPEDRLFYIYDTVPPIILSQPAIVEGESFIDTDPGIGNGTALPSFTAADSVTQTVNLNTTGLSVGFHRIYYRYKDLNSKWGIPEDRLFYIYDTVHPIIAAPQPVIVKGESFIDTDPGVGNGTALPSFTAADSVTQTLNLNTTGLSIGFHRIYYRYKDLNSKWGIPEDLLFFIYDTTPPPIVVNQAPITKGEYFIDTDPGIGNGTAINFPSADTISQLIDINAIGLAAGNHSLFIRVKDAASKWSLYEGREFTVCDDILATPDIIGDNQLCNGEILTLDAGIIPGALSYLWKGPNGFTATSQTINIANVTQAHEGTYSVVAVRGTTTCDTSSRGSVIVMVNSVPNLTVTNPSAVCAPENVDITNSFIDNNDAQGIVAYYTDANATNALSNPQTVALSGTYYIIKTSDIGLCSDMKPVVVTINNKTTSVITETVCENYTLNSETYTVSGIYQQTLINAAGCDSTLTLNLTINQPTASLINETACESFTLNSETYTESGVYTQTITNIAGCDSIITLNLTINTVDATVVSTENNLTATATGASYQWIDCDNSNAAISGAINQSFAISASGNFAVIITENGCSETSVCTSIDFVGVSNLITKNGFVVYPNPANDWVMVKVSPELLGITYRIVNPIGKTILTGKLMNESTSFDLRGFPAGIYLIRVGEQNQQPFKVVKK